MANPIKKSAYLGDRRKILLLLKQDILDGGWFMKPEVMNKNCALQAWLAEPLLLVKQACGNPSQ